MPVKAAFTPRRDNNHRLLGGLGIINKSSRREDVEELDISHEMAILSRLAAQGAEPPPSRKPAVTWLSAAALTLAIGWGGTAYAARSGYTVASGETLYQIATRHFGAGARWVEIAALNKISDPAKVRAGQVITLPDPHERIDTGRSAGSPVRSGRHRVANSKLTQSQAKTRTKRDRHAAIGRTQDGIRIVPAGEVVLELPARRTDTRTAARGHLARPIDAERVRPRQDAEDTAPLPAPSLPLSDSPWRAVDGAAFLLGALGITGLLARGRSTARKTYRPRWQPELPPSLAPERA
jgi:hypothetical protein